MQVSLRNALATRALEGEFARLKRSRAGTLTFDDIVTRSATMQAVLQRGAKEPSTSTIPVLIEGESGVGKELIARAIHGSGDGAGQALHRGQLRRACRKIWSSRSCSDTKRAPLRAPPTAMTGKFVEASGRHAVPRRGRRIAARRPGQAACGRSRKAKSSRSAARKPDQGQCRGIISATNRDLITDVKAGRFREDLFYRLHVFPITVPPLRERAEDIPELTRHFLVRFAAEEGKRVRSMRADALRLLASYRWPGNVRQLENAIFRAVVLAEGEEIGLNEFPQIAAQRGDQEWPEEPARPQSPPANFADLAPVLGPAIQRDDDAGRALLPALKEEQYVLVVGAHNHRVPGDIKGVIDRRSRAAPASVAEHTN